MPSAASRVSIQASVGAPSFSPLPLSSTSPGLAGRPAAPHHSKSSEFPLRPRPRPVSLSLSSLRPVSFPSRVLTQPAVLSFPVVSRLLHTSRGIQNRTLSGSLSSRYSPPSALAFLGVSSSLLQRVATEIVSSTTYFLEVASRYTTFSGLPA